MTARKAKANAKANPKGKSGGRDCVLFGSARNDNIDRYSELVAERMEHAGVAADPGMAESVAKYWPALEKLAAE